MSFSDDPESRRGESRVSLLLLVTLLVVPIFGGVGVLLLAALTAFVPGLAF